jgi:hypothetical protein
MRAGGKEGEGKGGKGRGKREREKGEREGTILTHIDRNRKVGVL